MPTEKVVNYLRAELVKRFYTAANILDRRRLIYIHQNFSFTEACVSEMKTTALCVFALFLSSMLVEGGMPNPHCCTRGAYKVEKVHE